jgi:D-amino-acid dehydrogenase
VAARVLDAAEVAACYPGVDVRAAGGVHYPDDAHRSPGALMRAWQEHLPDGASIRWGARAVAWRRRGASVAAVELENGAEVAGDAFVLAGGHATPPLARALGLHLPIQSGRGYSVTLSDPPQRPTVPAILVEGRVAMTPLPEGVRFGGTMEIAPADRPVDPRRVRGIAKAAARTFPAFEAESLAALPVWSGARPVSPDGLPYVGRLRRAPNVAVAAGHGMMGFSLGPVTGELVADLFAERAPRVPLDGLEPERFAGG